MLFLFARHAQFRFIPGPQFEACQFPALHDSRDSWTRPFRNSTTMAKCPKMLKNCTVWFIYCKKFGLNFFTEKTMGRNGKKPMWIFADVRQPHVPLNPVRQPRRSMGPPRPSSHGEQRLGIEVSHFRVFPVFSFWGSFDVFLVFFEIFGDFLVIHSSQESLSFTMIFYQSHLVFINWAHIVEFPWWKILWPSVAWPIRWPSPGQEKRLSVKHQRL